MRIGIDLRTLRKASRNDLGDEAVQPGFPSYGAERR